MADEEVDWGMDEDVWRQEDGVPAGGANEDEISLDGMEAESEGLSYSYPLFLSYQDAFSNSTSPKAYYSKHRHFASNSSFRNALTAYRTPQSSRKRG
jgi:hypothetical protein